MEQPGDNKTHKDDEPKDDKPKGDDEPKYVCDIPAHLIEKIKRSTLDDEGEDYWKFDYDKFHEGKEPKEIRREQVDVNKEGDPFNTGFIIETALKSIVGKTIECIHVPNLKEEYHYEYKSTSVIKVQKNTYIGISENMTRRDRRTLQKKGVPKAHIDHNVKMLSTRDNGKLSKSEWYTLLWLPEASVPNPVYLKSKNIYALSTPIPVNQGIARQHLIINFCAKHILNYIIKKESKEEEKIVVQYAWFIRGLLVSIYIKIKEN